jgi:hypothetical protein
LPVCQFSSTTLRQREEQSGMPSCCEARALRRRSPVWIPRRWRSCPVSPGFTPPPTLTADGVGTLPCAALVVSRDGSPQGAPPHPVLADSSVRHVGDAVAFIVASTIKQVRDAA